MTGCMKRSSHCSQRRTDVATLLQLLGPRWLSISSPLELVGPDACLVGPLKPSSASGSSRVPAVRIRCSRARQRERDRPRCRPAVAARESLRISARAIPRRRGRLPAAPSHASCVVRPRAGSSRWPPPSASSRDSGCVSARRCHNSGIAISPPPCGRQRAVVAGRSRWGRVSSALPDGRRARAARRRVLFVASHPLSVLPGGGGGLSQGLVVAPGASLSSALRTAPGRCGFTALAFSSSLFVLFLSATPSYPFLLFLFFSLSPFLFFFRFAYALIALFSPARPCARRSVLAHALLYPAS